MTNPFYESATDQAFRFGDVVTGFILATPFLKEPQAPPPDEYRLGVNCPRYAAVLSPCCSIGESTILLSPFLPVRTKWLNNPYLIEDLTRINREMTAQQSMPPAKWLDLDETERIERANSNLGYAELPFFVYDENPLLAMYFPKPPDTTRELRHYMIDFRKLYRVDCPAIKSPTDCPFSVKILQLSIPARRELRDKLAYFFGRTPEEDSIPKTATPPAGLASQDRGSQVGAD